MGPMAIPVFGGMTIEVITMFIVPVLYSAIKERKAEHGSQIYHYRPNGQK